jgi:hypothetical protein
MPADFGPGRRIVLLWRHTEEQYEMGAGGLGHLGHNQAGAFPIIGASRIEPNWRLAKGSHRAASGAIGALT